MRNQLKIYIEQKNDLPRASILWQTALELRLHHRPFWGCSLTVHPAHCGLLIVHQHVGQFLKTNLFTHTHIYRETKTGTPCWFSGNPNTSQGLQPSLQVTTGPRHIRKIGNMGRRSLAPRPARDTLPGERRENREAPMNGGRVLRGPGTGPSWIPTWI